MSSSDHFAHSFRCTAGISTPREYGTIYDIPLSKQFDSVNKVIQVVYNDVVRSGEISHIDTFSLKYCTVIAYKHLDTCSTITDIPIENRFNIITGVVTKLIDLFDNSSRVTRELYQLLESDDTRRFIMKLLNDSNTETPNVADGSTSGDGWCWWCW